MKPKFFRSPGEFRKWLAKHHRTKRELVVGYYRKAAGKPSMTWPESVAEALCYGWIDGIRRRIDERRYTIRFTPRRPRSTWSPINIRMVKELQAAGKMTAAGRAAFANHVPEGPRAYQSKEYKEIRLTPALVKKFKKNKAAWAFFDAQAPSYKRKAIWWVMSAKQQATRDSRFDRVVVASAAGKRSSPS